MADSLEGLTPLKFTQFLEHNLWQSILPNAPFNAAHFEIRRIVNLSKSSALLQVCFKPSIQSPEPWLVVADATIQRTEHKDASIAFSVTLKRPTYSIPPELYIVASERHLTAASIRLGVMMRLLMTDALLPHLPTLTADARPWDVRVLEATQGLPSATEAPVPTTEPVAATQGSFVRELASAEGAAFVEGLQANLTASAAPAEVPIKGADEDFVNQLLPKP